MPAADSIEAAARLRRLRQRAEQLLTGEAPQDVLSLSPDDLVALSRELRLHRTELEMQNDELRAAVAALRRSERRYRNLHDFTPVGYVTLDPLGHVLESNSNAAELLGRPEGLTQGEDFSTYIDRAQPDSWSRWRRATRVGASSSSAELRLRRPDGATVYADAVVSRITYDGGASPLRGLRLVLLDVTTRHELELASLDSDARIQRLFDGLGVLISYVDRQLRYAFVNAAHEAWFDIPTPQIVGRAVRQLIGEVGYTWLRGPLEEALAGESRRCEGELPDPSGAMRRVSATLMPDVDASGELRGVYCVMQDLTALRRAESDLRDAAADLVLAEQRERTRLAFELHDDVGQILSYASIKLRELRSSDPSRWPAVLAELDTHIGQVRERVASLSYQLEPPFLERGLRAAVLWLANEIHGMHGVRVQIDEGPELDDIEAAVRIVLYRSLRELILNVARHSRAGEARVSMRRSAYSIDLNVQDKGVGFDVSRHWGFGLESVRRRLSQLGGTLEIDSSPGTGTTARVRLPVGARELPT